MSSIQKKPVSLATKMIVWTHNVHLLKDTTAQYWSMGGYLTKRFSDRYFALALDTYQGVSKCIESGGIRGT